MQWVATYRRAVQVQGDGARGRHAVRAADAVQEQLVIDVSHGAGGHVVGQL